MTAKSILGAIILAVVIPITASGSGPAQILGTVLSTGGDPVVGAAVSLPELRRQT